MMHAKLDLNLFLVLKTVYQEGSITAAAKKLHLTQPAVSHAMARLREKLNDPLFVRHGRKITPSHYCQKIMPQVISALDLLDSTLESDFEFDINEHQRDIRFGFRDIIEWIVFPELVTYLIANAPNITISSWQISLLKLEDALETQEVDIVIDALKPVSSNVRHTLVWNDNFSLVCRPEHPILSDLTLQRYIGAQHAVASNKGSTVDVVEMALANYGVTRDIVLRCDHYLAAASVVSQSDLLMTMANVYAHHIDKYMRVKVVPLPFEVPVLPVHMYWHKQSNQDPVNCWMRDRVFKIVRYRKVADDDILNLR